MSDANEIRSRRSVLTAALAGVAGLVGATLRGPGPVRAGSDGDVVLGDDNTATAKTTIANTSNNETVLGVSNTIFGATALTASGHLNGIAAYGQVGVVAEGTNDGIRGSGASNGVVGHADGNGHSGVLGWSTTGYGVKAQSESAQAVFAHSASSTGVLGTSATSAGVQGESNAGIGVVGTTGSQTQPGIRGASPATGVYGVSVTGIATPPTPPAKTGVFGYSATDASSTGVHGKSVAGTGVRAEAGAAGTALRVDGRATFSRSGLLTMATGAARITKAVAGLTSGSLVFAVVKSGSGDVWVRKVSPTAGSFTVYLNKAVGTATTISWIAFG
jgi:hypothetical protein